MNRAKRGRGTKKAREPEESDSEGARGARECRS